jgi:polar amino acid transport system ATP-binding protein
MSTLLSVQGLSARYGANPVLRDVSMGLGKGEVLGVIGPSGSGKSSLLRALVGLLAHEAGTVSLDGQPVDFSDRASLARARDRIAIVFQQFNLFQNMTVLRNVMLAPLLVKKRDKAEVEARAVEMLGRVGLGHKLDAYPDELSGGQQQRVAIARAVVLKPEILLLDEVTSALDPELVNEVLDTIRMLASEGMAMIIVSHEMEFIREIASRVLMFDGGKVIAEGTTEAFFTQPQGERAAQFLQRFNRTSARQEPQPALRSDLKAA